jgi:hypothetical protein
MSKAMLRLGDRVSDPGYSRESLLRAKRVASC